MSTNEGNDPKRLDNLRQKAEFLRREKRKIIKARKAELEIKRLEQEINDLRDERIHIEQDGLDEFKKRLISGSRIASSVLAKIKKIKNDSNPLPSSSRAPKDSLMVEDDVKSAVKHGRWTVEDDAISKKAISAELEHKWQIEKDKQEKVSKEKAVKNKKDSEAGLLGCLGILAWFFPIFWPFLIIQLCKTYPITCSICLGLATLLIVVSLSMN